MKISADKNQLPKFGLVVGIIVGIALVNQGERLMNNVQIRSIDSLGISSSAAVIDSLGVVQTTVPAYKIQALSPAPGSLIDSNQIFSWDPVEGVSDYRALLGTYKGGLNLGYVDTGETTMAAFDHIPAGQPVYLRLIYTVDGKDVQMDAEYKVKN